MPSPREELPAVCSQRHGSRVLSALKIRGRALGLAARVPFGCSDCGELCPWRVWTEKAGPSPSVTSMTRSFSVELAAVYHFPLHLPIQ